jgi:hypothetical protein
MTEKTFVKNVTEIYKSLEFFKKLAMSSIASNAILGFVVGYLILAPTIVISESEKNILSFSGERKEIVVTEKEIKKIAEDFIKRRYQWDEYSQSEILANLTPLLTSGLKEKIADELKKQHESFKTVSQYVGKVQITVDAEGNVVGVFDKILRITGNLKNDSTNLEAIQKIPLLSESQILLKVVRGSVTLENPLGIYVNSVVNYEQN